MDTSLYKSNIARRHHSIVWTTDRVKMVSVLGWDRTFHFPHKKRALWIPAVKINSEGWMWILWGGKKVSEKQESWNVSHKESPKCDVTPSHNKQLWIFRAVKMKDPTNTRAQKHYSPSWALQSLKTHRGRSYINAAAPVSLHRYRAMVSFEWECLMMIWSIRKKITET